MFRRLVGCIQIDAALAVVLQLSTQQTWSMIDVACLIGDWYLCSMSVAACSIQHMYKT